jgi:hypothetical protein
VVKGISTTNMPWYEILRQTWKAGTVGNIEYSSKEKYYKEYAD